MRATFDVGGVCWVLPTCPRWQGFFPLAPSPSLDQGKGPLGFLLVEGTRDRSIDSLRARFPHEGARRVIVCDCALITFSIASNQSTTVRLTSRFRRRVQVDRNLTPAQSREAQARRPGAGRAQFRR